MDTFAGEVDGLGCCTAVDFRLLSRFSIVVSMKSKVSCEIRCLKCGKWFPSAIGFGSYEAFASSSLAGNLQKCAYCGEMTGCNKENMRFDERKDDGRVYIDEGKDTF